MKKKFNLYCGLLIAAIVFGIGLTMVQTGYQMYSTGICLPLWTRSASRKKQKKCRTDGRACFEN